MAQVVAILGVNTVISNMRRKNVQMGIAFSRGLKLAGLHLQAASQRIVPVDLGNLKASAFTRSTGIGWGTKVHVGYTAAYAIYVHENAEMKLKGQDRPAPSKGKYWDPQGRGQSKFLEEPARTQRPAMRALIAKAIRLA